MKIDMVFSGFPFTIDNDLKRTGMFALRPVSPVMPLAPDLTSVLGIPPGPGWPPKFKDAFSVKKKLKYFKILICGTIHDFLFRAIWIWSGPPEAVSYWPGRANNFQTLTTSLSELTLKNYLGVVNFQICETMFCIKTEVKTIYIVLSLTLHRHHNCKLL